MISTHTLRRIVPLAALPFAMGSYCGISFDFTETFLVTDPVQLIVIDVDDGNVDAVAYDRPAILLKRHTFGFENVLLEPNFTVENGVASFEAHCKKRDKVCSFDHMLEVPLGVGFDLTMIDARIDIGYVDADITASFETGFFHGVRLAAPQLDLTASSADFEVDYVIAPEAVVIDVGSGDVSLSVPPGNYQCLLDAEDGAVTMASAAVVCSDMATSVLDVRVGHGDITVAEAVP